MKANLFGLGRAAVLASMLLVVPASSQATVLVPGGAVMPDILIGSAGTLVDSMLTPLTSGGNLIANLRTAVVMNAGGTLDFYYQIGNKGTSGHNLEFSLNQSFATGSTFVTDVFFRLENGGLDFFHAGNIGGAPSLAARSGDGSVVGFHFLGGAFQSALKINPGEVSRIVVVRTNATDYIAGTTTVGNSISLSGASFAPFAPAAVPEPASLLLLGSAFAAAGYVARHRVAKKKSTVV